MQHYGNGPSTGLDQTAAGKITTGLCSDDVFIARPDREVLVRLAERVAQIAASPRMAETRQLWQKLNRLEKTRPVVFCDPENGWNEIITEAEMQCQGKLARRWEMDLRKEIFWAEEMGDDKPLDRYFDVPYTVSADDWGLQTVYHRTASLGSCVWDAPIKDYDADLKKLHSPRFEIDWKTTRGCLDLAGEVLQGILPARLKGIWWWSLGVTMPAVFLRGLTDLLYDLCENPQGLKELLAIISRGHMEKLDYLESNHLLSLNNDSTYVGSGGFGISDELPGNDFSGHVRRADEKAMKTGTGTATDSGSEQAATQPVAEPVPVFISSHVRCQDMWGFTESQETVGVSPEMYEEFIFPCEKPIMDRFGLTCYGCCEPLHGRWHVVKRHHNLRRVSCSPWADLEKMADCLQDRYILSYKPNPAALAVPEIDERAIREGLRRALDITRGCVVEVIMKDNHTLARRPENAVRWCRIAKEEIERGFP